MGKRKRKNSESHLRKKIKRLQEKLERIRSDSSSDDEYYNDDPQVFPRQTSVSPTSDIEVPIVYDSDSSASHQGLKSVVASGDQPSNPNTIALEPEPSSETTVEQIGTNSVPTNITSSNPGPSTSVDASSLPSEVLEALGDPKGKEEVFGPKIPDEIAKRWGRVLVDGLTKELKQDIMEKALIPDNFRLAKAPILNPEVLPVLNDAAKHRDKQMEKYQNQLGRGISGLTILASNIIEGNTDKIDLLKKLSETSQILLDLHYEETKRRRKLVTTSLDKKILGMISDVKRDEFLFGNNLNDKIKASKTAERSGLQIKRTDTNTAAAFRKYPQQGNWRGPPRAQPARTYKQGGQRNRYIPQPNRRPPPNQDRQSRLPTKLNSNTKTRKT